MVIVDASGRIVLVNLQVEMLFGYSRSELLGNTVEMLVPERFRARHTMHRGEYLQSPQVRPMGWRLNSLYGLHKNGTEFPIEVSLSPLQTEEGVLVASAIRNISKRLVMEQALERERARLEIILSTVNDGIHIIRDDGVLVEANHAFLSMLGYDNTAIGHLRVDQWHGQDTWEVIHERMTRIIQSKKLIVFPSVYRRKDGSRLQVEISACPVEIDEQQFICASSRDITERAALMHQLKELNESLEEHVRKRTEELAIANRDLESFTYSVSHDLRAPVRAMASYARIVDENESGHLSPRGHDMLERIRVNAGRLGELIDDMLQFSRIGRYQLSFQIVNMAALARAVVDDLRSDYPRAEIVVGNMPEVRGDASMLRQVWTNLIGNALKFSSKSERPLVTIGSNNLHDQPEFFVQDNGAGFDMEFAHKLFEVFQRLHTEKEFPGTGVGLAIVKRIIERHGGKVWAHGEPNMGAIFRFTIGN